MFDLLDGPDRDVASTIRFDNLYRWRNTSKTLTWTETSTEPVALWGGRDLKTFGCAYVQRYRRRDWKIAVFQAPSLLKGIPAREWVVGPLGLAGTHAGFAYDHASQLLVILQYE